jgi:hypothetical protein
MAAGAQTPDASLADALSLLSFGLLVPRLPAPEVTHDGGQYHARIPLPVLTSPPNAAIEAVARRLDAGIWDITALTLPPTGAMTMLPQGSVPAGVMAYSIGQQMFQGKIDPTLAVPSPFRARFGKITLRTENAPQHTDQTIEQVSTDGTLSGDAHGRLNIRSRGSLTNWLATGAGDKPGDSFRLSARSVAFSYDVDGLDRARAEHMRATAQALTADAALAADAAAPAGKPRPKPGLSPAARERLNGIVEDLAALLTRFDMEETARGVHFDAAGSKVDIGAVRFGLAGEARDDRVNAHLDISVSDPVASGVPAEYAALMPQHVTVRPAISGVRSAAFMQWLRDATAPDRDPAALQARTMALLSDPDATVGIEAMTIESGPLVVEGSARIRPLPGDMAGYDIHLTARGLDAMMATLQRNPQAIQLLPLVLLAKGMAKTRGDTLVWDIAYANGAITVNNVPLAQPPARR